jgi:peptidoglycan hydrolase CwlO-like protein
MDTETRKFLEAEEQAAKLVSTLEKLQTEATSLQTARGDLQTTTARLSDLITAMKTIAQDTHQSVQTLNQIGAPEILRQLAALEKQSEAESARQIQSQKRLLICIIAVLILSFIGAILGVFSMLV